MIGEYEDEPVKGLPERLPPGERLLWQGAPRWQSLAVRAFHVRKVAVYFGLLAAWRIAEGLAGAHTVAAMATSLGSLAAVAAAALGLLCLLAWLNARAAVYTITDRRVVMRIGVALPMMINLPYRSVESAGVRVFADGAGDVSLALLRGDRIAYLHLWPHARRWRLARPEPTLRAVPDAVAVARTLADALAASAGVAARPALDATGTPAAPGTPAAAGSQPGALLTAG